MSSHTPITRWLVTLFLASALLLGTLGASLSQVEAAPKQVVSPGEVVISEFRVRGPTGASDEFVELYNPNGYSVDIGDLRIRGSNATGVTGARFTIPSSTIMAPGSHYLVVGSTYSGTTMGDTGASLSSGTTDDGGFALTLLDTTTIIDQVGMTSCVGCYAEGTPLLSLGTTGASNLDRGYERKPGSSGGSCTDVGDNSSDFQLITPSDPQNSSSPAVFCLGVETVTPSPLTVTVEQPVSQADPTASLPINFTVQFSIPILVGTFEITDITQNGTATGIVWSIIDSGDHTKFTLRATTLAVPGTLQPSIAQNLVTGLGGNTNSQSTSIDNSVVFERIPPAVTINQSVGQADPTQVLPINFTVVFSEPINVDSFLPADITQSGAATGITWTIMDSGDRQTFTLSAVRLSANGTLIPSIGANKVTDLAGNGNSQSTSTDNSVRFSGVVPTPTRTLRPSPTATPTFGLYINEVAWMGTASNKIDEWIELYNPGPLPINLLGLGCYITNSSGSTIINLDLDKTIPDNGYFVIAANPLVFSDPLISDLVVNFSLSDSGEVLRLFCAGMMYDTANSDGGGWPAGTASPNFASMERIGNVKDSPTTWATFSSTIVVAYDRNIFPIKGTPGTANWATTVTLTPRPTPTGTLTPVPSPTSRVSGPVPILVLNEFLARPGHDFNNDGLVNTYDEYIEVINAGTVVVNLGNYKLDDEQDLGSAPFALPSQVLKPGEKAVFFASQTGISLSDAGDTVRLLRASNSSVVDAYTYYIIKSLDISYCRLTDGYGDWVPRCFPTPGFPNALAGSLPLLPYAPSGSACLLPDTTAQEFVHAECMEAGLGIWNPAYWDAADGGEIWFSEFFGKWTVIYQ